MATTFQKRQKEMKKTRKAAREGRTARTEELANREQRDSPAGGASPAGDEAGIANGEVPAEPAPQN